MKSLKRWKALSARFSQPAMLLLRAVSEKVSKDSGAALALAHLAVRAALGLLTQVKHTKPTLPASPGSSPHSLLQPLVPSSRHQGR